MRLYVDASSLMSSSDSRIVFSLWYVRMPLSSCLMTIVALHLLFLSRTDIRHVLDISVSFSCTVRCSLFLLKMTVTHWVSEVAMRLLLFVSTGIVRTVSLLLTDICPYLSSMCRYGKLPYICGQDGCNMYFHCSQFNRSYLNTDFL